MISRLVALSSTTSTCAPAGSPRRCRAPAWERGAFTEVARESHADVAPWPYHFVRYKRVHR